MQVEDKSTQAVGQGSGDAHMASGSRIKFNKHHVTNGVTKARVYYSLDGRIDGRASVTLYAKDYSDSLAVIFPGDEYRNGTDISSDYFEKGRVVLFDQHPHYAAARARAEAIMAARRAAQNGGAA